MSCPIEYANSPKLIYNLKVNEHKSKFCQEIFGSQEQGRRTYFEGAIKTYQLKSLKTVILVQELANRSKEES